MSYKEADIMHENGNFWVLREKDAYVVFRAGVTHSVSDSTYAKTPDGLSIAIARCNYLAKRARARGLKQATLNPFQTHKTGASDMHAKQALGKVYEAVIGYDPFADDPTIDPEAVVQVLREAMYEYPNKKSALYPSVWVFERIDFDGDIEAENLECVNDTLAALNQDATQ